MYKYVFIDLDDTLLDTRTNARLSLHEVFEEKKLNSYFDSFEQFYQIFVKRNLELWELYESGVITKEFLMTERFRHPFVMVGADNVKLSEQIGSHFLEILPTKTNLVPFAKELLNYLHPKCTLTIVSNGFVELQHKKLCNCGIEHYFSNTADALNFKNVQYLVDI